MKTFVRIFCAAVLLPLATLPASRAQHHLWTGLREKQPEQELPKGKTPFQTPVKKAGTVISQRLPDQNNDSFRMGWKLTEGTRVIEQGINLFDPGLDTSQWYDATIPGTVLGTLVDQGVYPDPYFGLNNLAIPDTLCRMDWWYRKVFDIPPAPGGERARLIFKGINYIAEVFLNGRRLGNIEGAFIRGEFDVTDIVRRGGKNVLAVHILPPRNPGIPHEQSIAAGQGLNGGALSMDGPTFISSVGWDWIPGIRDRNIGIWQDVELRFCGNVQIGDPLITTRLPNLPDTTLATITVAVPLKNLSSGTVSGTLSCFHSGNKPCFSLDYKLEPGEELELVATPGQHKELNINNPRLWWPNGYGNPELYRMEFIVTEGNKDSDRKSVSFGIRELSYELMVATGEGNRRILYTPVKALDPGKPVFDYVNRARYNDTDNQLPSFAKGADLSCISPLPQDDPVGPYLTLRINGVRVFARGGNWGMDDGMKRYDPDYLWNSVNLHREAGFNIIRNWTGETTQENFYDYCDKLGILVWNDFWITTDDTVEPLDAELFIRNARDVVRRFRNHPSIIVWCPRNEGFAPRSMERSLPAMMAAEDPTRHYHGQSRFLNMDTSGPWSYFPDPAKYYTRNAKGFITEIGTYAIPTAGTIRKFIGEEDLWPINDVWAYHDLHHTSQNFPAFIEAVNRYGEARNMEDFARKSQLVCYDAWRAIMEAWNSRMWDNTTGQILWMSHPAWPSMIWQTYTYDLETPGSYFGAKKACEPLHIQMNLHDNEVVLINSTRAARRNLRAMARFIDPFSGKVAAEHSSKHDAAANSLTKCFTAEAPGSMPDIYIVRVMLSSGRDVLSVNDYWIAKNNSAYAALNSIAPADVRLKVRETRSGDIVEVRNEGQATAIGIKLNAIDNSTGQPILPAYFSDGYFNLLPGESRTILIKFPRDRPDYTVRASGFNL